MSGFTKKEAVGMLGLESKGSVDYAIPQDWADDFQRLTGVCPVNCFVWFYPERGESGIFGQPCPLTVEAKELLVKYNRLAKTSYPIPEYPKEYKIDVTVVGYKG